MIAKKEMSLSYLPWNKQWGTPSGHPPRRLGKFMEKILPATQAINIKGMFSLQPNNDTRAFEYPWAYFAANLKRCMQVLEIGGGLSGFQFVLSKSGMHVTNVDPGMDRLDWPVDNETVDRLNSLFKANVTLLNYGAEKALLEPNSFDRAFCISVI